MTTHRSTWKKFESRVAKALGGTRTPLSGGNSKHTRGDVIHNKFYVECKLSGDSDIMKLSWQREWNDAKTRAKLEGKIPMFVHTRKGSSEPTIVMNFKDFVELIKLQKEVEGWGCGLNVTY